MVGEQRQHLRLHSAPEPHPWRIETPLFEDRVQRAASATAVFIEDPVDRLDVENAEDGGFLNRFGQCVPPGDPGQIDQGARRAGAWDPLVLAQMTRDGRRRKASANPRELAAGFDRCDDFHLPRLRSPQAEQPSGRSVRDDGSPSARQRCGEVAPVEVDRSEAERVGPSKLGMEPRRGNRLVNSLIAETGSLQLLSRHHAVAPTRERAYRQPNLSSSVPSRCDARIRNRRMKISPLGPRKVRKLGLVRSPPDLGGVAFP
jgi:hypothetical protein